MQHLSGKKRLILTIYHHPIVTTSTNGHSLAHLYFYRQIHSSQCHPNDLQQKLQDDQTKRTSAVKVTESHECSNHWTSDNSTANVHTRNDWNVNLTQERHFTADHIYIKDTSWTTTGKWIINRRFKQRLRKFTLGLKIRTKWTPLHYLDVNLWNYT